MSDSTIDINKTIATAMQVITDPVGFYKSMPQSGGYTAPVTFVAMVAFVAAAIIFVLAVVGLGPVDHMGFSAAVLLPVYPVAAVIASFIMGGIVYLIFKLMGSTKDYEVAMRCVAYSFAVVPVVAAVSIITILGELLSPLWGCFLMYIASQHVHGLDEGKSKIVFGVLAAIFTLGNLF